jgi:glycosyltransferase involved in cell wall biosynthesis
MMIRFSVIIPNFNTSTVGQTVESLERQAYSPYQVIVVGMDKYNLIRNTSLVYFDRSDVPLSPAKARNRGAAQASGDVIAFIDADCIAQPNWLTVLAERFADPAVTIVGGGVDFHSHNYWTLADNIGMFHEYLASRPPGTREQLPSLNLAIRQQVFLDIGGFDEARRTSEDSDLTIRLRQQGHLLYFEPCAVVEHVPPRNRAADLFRHNFLHGQQSTKFDPSYGNQRGLVRLLHTRWGVTLVSPALAAGVTVRIFLTDSSLWRYWYTAPAIFLAKMAWCFGAAARSAEIRRPPS